MFENGIRTTFQRNNIHCVHTVHTLYSWFWEKIKYTCNISWWEFWVCQFDKKYDTPSPLRTAYRPILALRTAYRHFFGLGYCVPFNNKNNHFGRFHLHKEDIKNDSMSHQWRKLAYFNTHVRKMDNWNPKNRKVKMQNAIKNLRQTGVRGEGINVYFILTIHLFSRSLSLLHTNNLLLFRYIRSKHDGWVNIIKSVRSLHSKVNLAKSKHLLLCLCVINE